MFVTNWNSTTKIQKISEITNFFRHYFYPELRYYLFRMQKYKKRFRLPNAFTMFFDDTLS